MDDAPRPRFRFSVRRVTLAVLGCGAACAALVAALRLDEDGKRMARARACTNNLRLIALALHTYHAANDCFPPAVTYGPDGRPWHSWRVLIAPYMGSGHLAAQYDMNQPWDGPTNRALADRGGWEYVCPNHAAHADAARAGRGFFTSYAAVRGPGTALPDGRSASLADLFDRAASAVAVVEIDHPDILWTEPRDLDIRTMSLVVNDRGGPSISGRDPAGPHVAVAAGIVETLPPATPPGAVRARLTTGGGGATSGRDRVP